MFSQETTIM